MAVKVIAEIGQNHNGSLYIARDMIQAAAKAGADFVKFQKRDVRTSVPRSEWDKSRYTPWQDNPMSYIEYRERLEFDQVDYVSLSLFCRAVGVTWFASAWDIPSVGFLENFDVPYIKVPSAMLTNWPLLECIKQTGIPSILSTGMSTGAEIDRAMEILRPQVVMHCTSTYPAPKSELNLKCIQTLRERYPGVEVGYSGHETGLATTVAAVALGATWVERHFTLDRAMWGSDQSASVEPGGFKRMVEDIRGVEEALGDGVKKIEDGEWSKIVSLRGTVEWHVWR